MPAVTALDERSKHLRRLIVRGLKGGNCGHIGPSFSPVEILRVLYDDVMQPGDICILSKGHGALAQYALLVDKGIVPAEELDRFCQPGGILGGHPDSDKVPGIFTSTGSLGQGPAEAAGAAHSFLRDGKPNRVFVIVGDGEIQEGSVDEAVRIAAKHRLSNFTIIIDWNGIQSAGLTREIGGTEPPEWRGFETSNVPGHNLNSLRRAFGSLGRAQSPACLVCQTVKGKGIPWAEDDPFWHHRDPMLPEIITALEEAVA